MRLKKLILPYIGILISKLGIGIKALAWEILYCLATKANCYNELNEIQIYHTLILSLRFYLKLFYLCPIINYFRTRSLFLIFFICMLIIN